jgi:hypothetical protein
MLYTVFIVAFLALYVQAEGIDNLDSTTIYFCPTSQSIENYYAGTCELERVEA